MLATVMAVALQKAIVHKQIYDVSAILKFHRRQQLWGEYLNRLSNTATEGLSCWQELGVNGHKGQSS